MTVTKFGLFLFLLSFRVNKVWCTGQFECGEHGRFEYCIDEIPGCIIGCHCHPGFYFDTTTKICESNSKIMSFNRRANPENAEKVINATNNDKIGKDVEKIENEADNLEGWLYDNFFSVIEEQADNLMISSTMKPIPKFEKYSFIEPLSGIVDTPNRHKKAQKSKMKPKIANTKSKTFNEGGSLFEASTSEEEINWRTSDDTEVKDKKIDDNNSSDDHDHRHIILIKRKKPKTTKSPSSSSEDESEDQSESLSDNGSGSHSLPSLVFLPNMETPFYPPLGLPPPPVVPMYPVVPVPPVVPMLPVAVPQIAAIRPNVIDAKAICSQCAKITTLQPKIYTTSQSKTESTLQPTTETTIQPTTKASIQPTTEITIKFTTTTTLQTTSEPTIKPIVETIKPTIKTTTEQENDTESDASSKSVEELLPESTTETTIKSTTQTTLVSTEVTAKPSSKTTLLSTIVTESKNATEATLTTERGTLSTTAIDLNSTTEIINNFTSEKELNFTMEPTVSEVFFSTENTVRPTPNKELNSTIETAAKSTEIEINIPTETSLLFTTETELNNTIEGDMNTTIEKLDNLAETSTPTMNISALRDALRRAHEYNDYYDYLDDNPKLFNRRKELRNPRMKTMQLNDFILKNKEIRENPLRWTHNNFKEEELSQKHSNKPLSAVNLLRTVLNQDIGKKESPISKTNNFKYLSDLIHKPKHKETANNENDIHSRFTNNYENYKNNHAQTQNYNLSHIKNIENEYYSNLGKQIASLIRNSESGQTIVKNNDGKIYQEENFPTFVSERRSSLSPIDPNNEDFIRNGHELLHNLENKVIETTPEPFSKNTYNVVEKAKEYSNNMISNYGGSGDSKNVYQPQAHKNYIGNIPFEHNADKNKVRDNGVGINEIPFWNPNNKLGSLSKPIPPPKPDLNNQVQNLNVQKPMQKPYHRQETIKTNGIKNSFYHNQFGKANVDLYMRTTGRPGRSYIGRTFFSGDVM